MKFISFKTKYGENRFGLLENNSIIDLHLANNMLPDNALDFVQENEKHMKIIKNEAKNYSHHYELQEVELLAPIQNPLSFRDFSGFKEHLETIAQNLGLTPPKEFYEFPPFYFSNAMSIRGPEYKVSAPSESQMLDYEFEVVCVIGKRGINIKEADAHEFIWGYTILNDWSARDLQFKEMPVNLGPAKGKDFATSIGPYLVTKDELEDNLNPDGRYNLKTKLTVNGELVRENNLVSITHTFGAMIERASKDVMLYPGELIGSGTIGGGCILERGIKNVTWLVSGDRIEMEVEKLGVLETEVL